MFCIVFTARYMDMFVYFISLYNTSFKAVYLIITYATTILVYFKFKDPNRGEHDTFRYVTLISLMLFTFMYLLKFRGT